MNVKMLHTTATWTLSATIRLAHFTVLVSKDTQGMASYVQVQKYNIIFFYYFI